MTLAVLVVLLVATALYSHADMAMLRNALVYRIVDADTLDWTPESVPADFLWERAPPTPEFVAITKRVLGNAGAASDLEKALLLGRHLETSGATHGERIQKRPFETYREITENGSGYCVDYTQVFNALALAAGLDVREWGMSFNDYGGEGHAFSEIYDHSLHKWVFIDTYFSLYAIGGDGTPMSVAEFREALAAQDPALTIVPIDAAAFGFRSPERAIRYYRRGVDSFFLRWGNNVYSYDTSLASRVFGDFSRSLEQLGAIVTGVFPEVRIFRGTENAEGVAALARLRALLLATAFVALVCAVFAVLRLWTAHAGRRTQVGAVRLPNSSANRRA